MKPRPPAAATCALYIYIWCLLSVWLSHFAKDDSRFESFARLDWAKLDLISTSPLHNVIMINPGRFHNCCGPTIYSLCRQHCIIMKHFYIEFIVWLMADAVATESHQMVTDCACACIFWAGKYDGERERDRERVIIYGYALIRSGW